MTSQEDNKQRRCQVLVIGAGLAGISAALLIRKRLPTAKVVVVDKRAHLPSAAHSQALTGPAGVFFQMALHASGLLAREHLPRYGEHFWFATDPTAGLAQLTEIGADEFASHPGHHVDCSRLAHGLQQAAAAQGVVFLLDTEATHVRVEWPASTVYLKDAEGTHAMQTRWIVDASGDAALLTRQFEIRHERDTQARSCVVANWSGERSFDELTQPVTPEDRGALPPFSRSREFATHNFFGPDWRVAVVPHMDGGCSVRLDTTREHFDALRGVNPALGAYSNFLRTRPGLRELLREAQVDADSFRLEHGIDWTARRHCDRGWILVGAAAGSLATLFPTPLDTLARGLWNAAEIIRLDLGAQAGEARVVEELRLHNLRERQHDEADGVVLQSTTRALCGDAALFAVAFSLRRSLRSLELARLGRDLNYFTSLSWHSIWQRGLRQPAFERLRRLAILRQKSGDYGVKNAGWRLRLGPGEGTLRPLVAAAHQWLRLESASLQVAMAPIPGDVHQPPGPEIERRIALLPTVSRSTHSQGPVSE